MTPKVQLANMELMMIPLFESSHYPLERQTYFWAVLMNLKIIMEFLGKILKLLFFNLKEVSQLAIYRGTFLY